MSQKNNKIMDIKSQNNLIVTSAAILFLAAITALFWDTFIATVNTWETSDTYGHGYFIPVLSLYYAWLKRHELHTADIKPFVWAIIPIIGLSLLWLVGELSFTNVVKQFSFFFLPFFGVLFLFGAKITKILSFPLLFLIFCIPFGEGLIPTLQVITAEITIFFIELIGLPVFVDGLFITLTSGVFEVAKACSGISYLISSLAIGSFYAFITYNSAKKRLLFMLFSLVVPIVANGLRAVIIVLLAHYSDLAIATGFDHLVYGWVFFGFIIFIMFSIGGRWADKNVFKEKQSTDKSAPKQNYLLLLLFIAVLPLISIKYFALKIESVESNAWSSNYLLHNQQQWKQKALIDSQAISSFPDADKIQFSSFEKDRFITKFYGAYFQRESENVEVISFRNKVYDIEEWSLDVSEQITIKGQSFLRYEIVNSLGKRRQLIFAYIVNGDVITSPIFVKLALLKNKILNSDSSAMYVAFSSDYVNHDKETKAKLVNFIEEHLPQLL